MKKYLLSVLALVLGVGMLHAGPVDVNRAKMVGQQFAQSTMETKGGSLELVYAPVTERGNTAFYVFNIGKEGFVVVSADDYYRPIIGFSMTEPFDLNVPGRAYYLRTIERARRSHTGTPSVDVAAEWEMLANEGRLMSKNGGRAVAPLCSTKWNQSYPYNYYCPEFAGCPGGHFYAGCVATAMSQVMKRWNHPLHGTGSHTYTSQAHPYTSQHPVNVPAQTCTANFGATTYDWDNMPVTLSSGSPQVQIDAVATLMYHCAVAVDMDWDYDGSGSNSQLASQRISVYFDYTNAAVYQRRANFSPTVWAQKVKESLDMGWPLLYSGTEEGAPYGHAFVLDGYRDDDFYHFNWGWGGTGDDYFTFETQDYHVGDGAIFNFVPSAVYASTPQAPTAFTVTPAADNELSATLSWTNPSHTMTNATLPAIDQIIIKRGEEVIATLDNATPGSTMTYVDNEVPRFDQFQYSIYAVYSGSHGKTTYSEITSFGPTCNWTVMMSSNLPQGWRGGNIALYNSAGSLIRTMTTTTSSPSSVSVAVPVGKVHFVWNAPSEEIPSMTIIIKNSQNQTVFNYTGASADFAEGTFYEVNNGCGNEIGTGTPSNLVAIQDETSPYDINVSWDGVSDGGYGYNVYRDGLLYRTVLEGTSFVDHNAPVGGHCYYVVFLSYGGENENSSNESCANAGVGCDAPYDLDYEATGAQHKIKLKWHAPDNTDGLSTIEIYRKKGDEAFRRIKSVSPTATSYTDNSLNQEGNYSYRVCGYYEDTDCISAPAYLLGDHNRFQLDVYWSPTGVDEANGKQISVFPNPNNGSFMVEGEALQQVMVFNALGQLMLSSALEGNSAIVNLNGVEPGFYMVKVITANGESIKKVSVIR